MNEVKELSKSQRGFLIAIRQKHDVAFGSELNLAMKDIADELGLGEEARSGKVQFQLSQDYSKITIVRPPDPLAPPKNVAPKIPKKK